eukprot:gene11126-20005_t
MALRKETKQGEGVSFFSHFPKNFLRPYGKAEETITEETILRRITPKNCEWLCRPQTAISELHATLSGNIEILDKTPLLTAEKIEEGRSSMRSLMEPIQAFSIFNDLEPSQQNVKDFFNVLLTDENADAFFKEAFALGGALFTTAIQFFTVKSLVINIDEFGKRIAMREGDLEFKNSPSLKTLRNILLGKKKKAARSSASTATRATQLLEELDEDDDDTPQEKKKWKKKETKHHQDIDEPQQKKLKKA